MGIILLAAAFSSVESQAASLAEVGISKEQVAQYDRIASEKVQGYVNKEINPRNRLQQVVLYSDGLYQIRFKDAPFYLNTANGRSFNGNTFKSGRHSYNASYVFYLKNIGNGEVMIFDVLNFRAMEIANSTCYNGSKLQLWDANPDMPTMRWRIEKAPKVHNFEVNSVQIVNVNSNLAVDAKGGHVTNTASFHAWSRLNASNQKFLLECIR
ncbi:RICIN domain-containing protein [Enterococcus sp. LJL99]